MSDTGTTSDAGDGAVSDGAKLDAADGSTCGADNTACKTNGNDSLCKGGACSACTNPTDDSHCTAAYGSASTPYLCLAGVCTPGDCRHNIDCAANPNGALCGASAPNLCGKCTSDKQCVDQAGGPVCNTTTGECVAGTCAIDAGVTSGDGVGTCPVNASDICCTGTCQPGPGANACCPGAAAAAYCATKLANPHATCTNNVCTACPAVTGGTYSVDPVNGSDQAGTGDGTVTGCGFKTIARALQVIGAPVAATTISVLGPSTVMAGETFPIVLPANVTLTTAGGAVEVDVPDGTSGFTLNAANSAIDGGTLDDAGVTPGLTINGRSAGNNALFGIQIDTGMVTLANSPQISNVIVTSFVNDGILVENAGIVRIGGGVTSTLNGTDAARRAGLHVTANGQAVVDVGTTDTPTHFDANTNQGILVDANGQLTVTATVTDLAAGTGTVTTNRNYQAGIWIEQTPGTPPLNSISGVVAFGNTNGSGIHLFGGSSAKLRNSALVGNQLNGLIVTAAAGGPGNDISGIDLGTNVAGGGTFGDNTFQLPLGMGNNGGAGLCLDMGDNAGTLAAAGNVFQADNCATGVHALTFNAGACDNTPCAGGVCDLGITDLTGNDIDVTMCTH